MGAAESSAPQGLEKVRKELQAVKTVRDPGASPAFGLPPSALPDWQGGAAPSPPSATTLKSPVRDPKSVNWLIDGMNRQPSLRTQTELQARPGEGDLPLVVAERKSRARGPVEGLPLSTAAEFKPAPSLQVAPDPFARFLGEWMTPSDYALLKSPTPNESVPRESVRAAAASTRGRDGPALDLSASLAANAGAVPVKRTADAAVPRENPYLHSLVGPALATSPSLVLSRPVGNSGPRPATGPNSLETAPPVPAHPKAPDFAKPTDDEKYFKQLKRF